MTGRPSSQAACNKKVLNCGSGRRMHSPVVHHLVSADGALTNVHAIEQKHKACNPFSFYRIPAINGSTESVDMLQFLCLPAV